MRRYEWHRIEEVFWITVEPSVLEVVFCEKPTVILP